MAPTGLVKTGKTPSITRRYKGLLAIISSSSSWVGASFTFAGADVFGSTISIAPDSSETGFPDLRVVRSRINRIRLSRATVAFVSCKLGGINPFGKTDRLQSGHNDERF
jgi:hypothetical protein